MTTTIVNDIDILDQLAEQTTEKSFTTMISATIESVTQTTVELTPTSEPLILAVATTNVEIITSTQTEGLTASVITAGVSPTTKLSSITNSDLLSTTTSLYHSI